MGLEKNAVKPLLGERCVGSKKAKQQNVHFGEEEVKVYVIPFVSIYSTRKSSFVHFIHVTTFHPLTLTVSEGFSAMNCSIADTVCGMIST